MGSRRIKLHGDEQEEEFDWVMSTLTRMSFLIILVTLLVVGAFLNCYVEQRRDEARSAKREREK